MEGILKMLFERLVMKMDSIQEVKTVEDLCRVSYSSNEIAKIFSFMNDDQDGFGTEEILEIANEAYQEVCAE